MTEEYKSIVNSKTDIIKDEKTLPQSHKSHNDLYYSPRFVRLPGSSEIKRISEKYKKEYLDCSDIMEITGLGRDNVTRMMSKKDFPKMKVGRRRIVSVASFVTWQMMNEFGGNDGKEEKDKIRQTAVLIN